MAERHEILGDLLQAVNRDLYERVKDVLQEHGLPLIGMVLMRQVRGEPGITISELSRKAGIAKSHISKTVESLARQGFLEKRADAADQRLVRVYPTEHADRHFQELQAAIRRRLSAVLAEVPEEKVDALIDGLRHLQGVLERTREAERPD